MKYEIIMSILISLMQKPLVSTGELAAKLEISRRTVFRYIDVLCMSGVPIVAHRGSRGGFSLSSAFVLDRMYFKKEEINRIIDSLLSTKKTYGDQLNSEIVSRIGVLNNTETVEKTILKNEHLIIDSSPWGDIYSYKHKTDVIKKAIYNQMSLKIEYHSRKNEFTNRTIDPYSFVLKDGIWYIFAYCNLRKSFRFFKIGRIGAILETGMRFERRPYNMDELLENEKWYNVNKTVNLVIKFFDEKLFDVEEWLGIENIKKLNSYYIASATLPDDERLIKNLLALGNGVEILEPLSTKNKFVKILSSVYEEYKH